MSEGISGLESQVRDFRTAIENLAPICRLCPFKRDLKTYGYVLQNSDICADKSLHPARLHRSAVGVGRLRLLIRGARSQLREDDGDEYYVRTISSDGRQIAGVNVRLELPVAVPEDVYELRVRVRARVSRVDGAPVIRMSLRNLADNRYDTVIELTPTSTSEQEVSFATSSLRHVTSDAVLQFNVIADLDPGDPADLWIDLVEVELVTRQ